MKRGLMFALVLVLMLTINITVLAAENTYDLSDLGLEVTIPSGYSVITRDTPANDPIFSEYGTTKSAIMSQFESGNIYLNAVSNTSNEEIVVTMAENAISNFSLFSDTMLNTLATTLINELDSYGINVSKYEIYQHSQAKFIRVFFNDTANTVHGLQYYTVYDGKAMNFTMRSYEGSLSSKQESTIKAMVDSINFSSAPPIPEPGVDTMYFEYTDTESGVTFTVPANWKQEALTKDREYVDVKFVSTKEAGCMMLFGNIDMWSQMPASERVGYSRADLNNSIFTKSEIAEMYGVAANKVSVVTYNGVQYYKIEMTASSNTYGLDISATTTRLLRIDNGWMYSFAFSGTSDHKLYSDFESLLNSVQYPTVSNASGIDSANSTISVTNLLDNSLSMLAIVVLLVIVAVIVTVVVIKRKKSAELEMAADYPPTYNTPTPTPSTAPTSTISCENCGQALPLDSEFCHICGTRINREEVKR